MTVFLSVVAFFISLWLISTFDNWCIRRRYARESRHYKFEREWHLAHPQEDGESVAYAQACGDTSMVPPKIVPLLGDQTLWDDRANYSTSRKMTPLLISLAVEQRLRGYRWWREPGMTENLPPDDFRDILKKVYSDYLDVQEAAFRFHNETWHGAGGMGLEYHHMNTQRAYTRIGKYLIQISPTEEGTSICIEHTDEANPHYLVLRMDSMVGNIHRMTVNSYECMGTAREICTVLKQLQKAWAAGTITLTSQT